MFNQVRFYRLFSNLLQKYHEPGRIVIRSKSSRPAVRLESEKAQSKHFVDFKRIRVTGGNGGNGARSFMSLYANEWAGPDGGDGGNGGHIFFEADGNVTSLGRVHSLYVGVSGAKGGSKHCSGRHANHTYIKVPVGTFFRNEGSEVVADLREKGDLFLAARGGAGGKGNYYFLSNEIRAPTTYEEGGKGEVKTIYAELRVMAHIGMVGFPNAGKSTLLRAISRARPKVAAYPFTTLYPHVGVVEFKDYEQIFVADIPGLIEGAHMNRGLGCSFLRHIERCQCLLYVIDLSSSEPWATLDMLRHELEQYEPGLSMRPHIVVANKCDLPMSARNIERFKDHVGEESLFIISAKHKTNIASLVERIRILYDRLVVQAGPETVEATH